MGGFGSDYSYSADEAVTRKSAAAYNIDSKRSYQAPVEEKARLPPPKDKVLLTKAKFPVAIGVDVTGSMSKWPKIIFEKLCILYNETRFFLPTDLKDAFEISFVAIGDAYSDRYPLQVTDFTKEAELDENLTSLYPEGCGGGGARETYELAAYYYATRCEMPKALPTPRPVFIFIGDEGFYSKVNRGHIKALMGDPPKTDLISAEVFEQLKKKFETYILRVEYYDSVKDEDIQKEWAGVLGDHRVIFLAHPRRVVDVILGILAAHVDMFATFQERIEIRQTPEQVKQVYGTLDGLRVDDRAYLLPRDKLKCPKCGTDVPTPPTPDQPRECSQCGLELVKI